MEVTSQRYGAHRSLALVDYNDAAAILHSPTCCSLRNTAPPWPFSQRLAHALCSADPPREAHCTDRVDIIWSVLSCCRECRGSSSRAQWRRAVHARAELRCRGRAKSRPAGSLRLYSEVGVLFTKRPKRRALSCFRERGLFDGSRGVNVHSVLLHYWGVASGVGTLVWGDETAK